tara:strand:+ start:67231 stop:67536 length:306 start_codon:yes stop_codon:yes gene_type:complete
MTDNKMRDRNRKSWTNLRHYELSYRHGNDAIPQTRYFQSESPEEAFDAFYKAFHGKTSDLVVVYMTVDNPYSSVPEIIDVRELLAQNSKYAEILVDNNCVS